MVTKKPWFTVKSIHSKVKMNRYRIKMKLMMI